jgi:hypothetical protein
MTNLDLENPHGDEHLDRPGRNHRYRDRSIALILIPVGLTRLQLARRQTHVATEAVRFYRKRQAAV